ncbi:hypothetical protein AB0M32_37085 [Streptomyces sp. NPDC051985]|uniref:hypothetical protein n=1 Tax=Streptomyces sp. NPDC051985 TaxID=3155807 RepID=UPI0034156AD4
MARSTGTRALRVEDPRLLLTSTGTSAYVADVVRPGVHAAFTAQDPNCRVREQWYTPNGHDDPDTPVRRSPRPPPRRRHLRLRRTHRRRHALPRHRGAEIAAGPAEIPGVTPPPAALAALLLLVFALRGSRRTDR